MGTRSAVLSTRPFRSSAEPPAPMTLGTTLTMSDAGMLFMRWLQKRESRPKAAGTVKGWRQPGG